MTACPDDHNHELCVMANPLRTIAQQAAEMAQGASPATRAVHALLIKQTPEWDADQRWAFAERYANAALNAAGPDGKETVLNSGAPQIKNDIVTLTYFKESGKYYTEASYKTTCTYDFEVYGEVRAMMLAGNNPGLFDGTVVESSFSVLVQPDGSDGVPCLLRFADPSKAFDRGSA